MSIEHVQAAFDRWHAAAAAGIDLITAVNAICSDDCVVHLQNGELGTRADAEAQSVQGRALYPDLSMEVEEVVTTEDRLLVQVSMSGKPSLLFRIARGQSVFRSLGAVVARVNDRAELVEMWPYLNPSGMLTFPPRARPGPPLPEVVPGTEEDADAVARQWKRASTGTEVLEQIIDSALPGCIVHGTNEDIGGLGVLEDHFRVILSAFPDLTFTFEDGYVVGDRLISQFILDGTHRGALGIAPARGARVQSTGAIVAHVTRDRLVYDLRIYLAPGMGLIFPRRDR